MAELTKDTLEEELQKDLAELEKKKPMGKKTTTTPAETTTEKAVKTTKKKTTRAKKKTTSAKKTVTADKKKSAVKKTEKAKSENKSTKTIEEKVENKTTPVEEKIGKRTAVDVSKQDPAKQSEENKDDDRSTRIFYGGIAAIIILFAALLIGGKYIPSADDNTLTYNGFQFVKGETHWTFDWQNDGVVYNIPLRFNPEEVESVRTEGVLDPRFNKLRPIYLTFDPVNPESNFSTLTLGASELSFSLVQALQQQIVPACASPDESGVCESREIVNCENGDGKAVIYIKTREPAGIFIQDTCIVIQGEGMDLLRSIDRLLYGWYGIIK